MLPDPANPYIKDDDKGKFTSEVRLELLKAVTEHGKLFRFTAPGFSMHPFIRNLDIITVAPLSESQPCTGDIVAFIRPETGKLIVHRVIGDMAGIYLIKGDNVDEPDGIIPGKNILGIVVRVERDGRAVRAGNGFDRTLIAYLSRHNYLQRFFLIINGPKIICATILLSLQKSEFFRKIAGRLGSGIKICEADKKDIKKIYSIWNFYSLKDELTSNSPVLIYSAKKNDKILAFIRIEEDTNLSPNSCTSFQISEFIVKILYRGMGIGEKLLITAIEGIRKEGAQELRVFIDESNYPALELFRKIGFNQVGVSDITDLPEDTIRCKERKMILLSFLL